MKKIIIGLIFSFLIPINLLAYSEYVIPGGENIGINIETKGLLVIGFYKIDGEYKASNKIRVGDYILKVEDQEVNSIKELANLINQNIVDNKVNLLIKRGNKTLKTSIDLYLEEDNIYKTGLYVKDSITGIGTITYIDPNTKIYGALGHEVIEGNTRSMVEVRDGKIFESFVTSIDKSYDGTPGSKNANIYYNQELGFIKKNSFAGVYGKYQNQLPNKEVIEVAEFDQIKKEEAYIITNIDGNQTKKYKIKITSIDKSKINTSKALSFEIIDKELLNETGGIVQGMSGSPIIQNNKLIGAVTHVIINDVSSGYGIFIRTMLKEGEQ